MRQFYQAYRGQEKVAPLVRQLPWTHNLIILGQSNVQESASFTFDSRFVSGGADASWNARSRLRFSRALC